MDLQKIQSKIYEIRGKQVMLDYDLAILYATETKVLKQAIKRNKSRFPPDFMFVLNARELKILRSQIVTSSSTWGGSRYLPFAFTEQGVAMLASILNSPKAIKVNIDIVRTFVFLRHFALSHKELTQKIRTLEKRYNRKFKDMRSVLQYLIQKDHQETLQKDRQRIGFRKEKS